ncbi:MAG: hypothetical protein J0H83_14260 [Candidatus Melainabacteria bacterium]|nr:hypothetical protein [Candidatus Melainabacteria bacterium]
MEQLLKPLADIFGTVTANGLAPITAATCVFVLLFDVCRRKALSTEKVGFKSSLPSLYVSIAAIALLKITGVLLNVPAISSPIFYGVALAAVGIGYLMAASPLKPGVVAFVHLAIAAIINSLDSHPAGLLPYATGLLLIRTCLNFSQGNKIGIELQDIASAVVYISAALFADQTSGLSGVPVQKARALVECAFITTALITVFQRPFTFGDRIWVKRLTLCVTAAIFFLVLVTKIVLAPEYLNLAVIFGFSMAAFYAVDGFTDKTTPTDERTGTVRAIMQVLMLGIITLAASRLYGNIGLGCVAACTMVGLHGFGRGVVTAAMALFIAARIFEQYFALNLVSNVTGVNMQHAYVSAANYFGFFVVMALALLLKETTATNARVLRLFDEANKQQEIKVGLDVPEVEKFENGNETKPESKPEIIAEPVARPILHSANWSNLSVAIALWSTMGVVAVNYFLHAEASAAYLISLAVAGILFGVLGQSYFVDRERRVLSLALIPALSSAAAILGGDLLATGETATINTRLTIIGVLAALAAISLVIGIIMDKQKKDEPVSATSSNA